jgi:F0F1-type ATP synthase epsilon subunit
MAEATLHFVIRTPQAIVLEWAVSSIRVPTETGQVGLRPHSEPTVLAVEPGLIVVRQDGLVRFAGTAGGLLHCDGAVAHLLTPVAVIGEALITVLEALDRALAVPSAEVVAAVAMQVMVARRPHPWLSTLALVTVEWLDALIQDIVGQPHPVLATLSGSLSVFIAGCNIVGQLPGIHPATASLAATSALALVVFLALPIAGIHTYGF